MDTLPLIAWITATSLLAALISGLYFVNRMHKKVSYILDALEDKETNFRFNEHTLFNRKFNRTLNRIRKIFEQEKEELNERESFYGIMMEQVRTGIAVIDLSERREGKVIYSNTSALNLLGMATFSHIHQLGNIDKELERKFKTVSSRQEEHCNYYNERGQLTLSITAAETTLLGKQVKIIAFNDITGEMVHNEDMSWNRLIRVLTHEIMNTVTPIASLSSMLAENISSSSKEGCTNETSIQQTKDLRNNEEKGSQRSSTDTQSLDYNELKVGLETIAASSKGLIGFVNTYRSLTRISAPVKKAFYLHELMEQVNKLVQEQLNEAGATFTYTEKSEDILLYADTNQLSQVFVNLIKNALQAGASSIEITAEIDFAESVVVQVVNNGSPIDKEAQKDIFVPFFTTKQEGSGIGLSLSRQIMRLHNGSIKLVRSNEKGTVFCLVFN